MLGSRDELTLARGLLQIQIRPQTPCCCRWTPGHWGTLSQLLELSAPGSSAKVAAVVLLRKVPQETPNATLTTTMLMWILHSLFMSPDEDTAQQHPSGDLAKPSLPALAKTYILNLAICFSAPTPKFEDQVSSQTHVSQHPSWGSIHLSSCSAIGWGTLTSDPNPSRPHLVGTWGPSGVGTCLDTED